MRKALVKTIAKPECETPQTNNQNHADYHQILLCAIACPNFAISSLAGVSFSFALTIQIAYVNIEPNEGHDANDCNK
jgi:hypothetical protein